MNLKILEYNIECDKFDEVNLFTPLRCVKRISAQIEERDSSIQMKKYINRR